MKKLPSARTDIRSKLRWGIAGIFGLLLVTIIFAVPSSANQVIDHINTTTGFGLPRVPAKPFSLGLDLQGGAHLVYEADVSRIPPAEQAEAVDGARDVIEKRVNGLGVTESTVQTTKVGDTHRIVIELPGIQDVKEATTLIGQTPILDFRTQDNTPPRELTAEEKKGLETYNKDAKVRAEALRKELTAAGADFATIVKTKSEDEDSKSNGGYLEFIPAGGLPENIRLWAEKAKAGDISPLLDSPLGYHIFKKGTEKDGEMKVTASHILICYVGSNGCANPLYTKEEARLKAKEVFDKANAGNFAALAKEFSDDSSNKENGGDLGSFTQETMVKAFADAAFSAKPGEIIGPVETEFGYHVIYKKSEAPEKQYELSHALIRVKTNADIVPPSDGWKATKLSGSQLERAEVVSDPQTGAVQVALRFNPEGRELFKQITEANIGKPVGIFLDGQQISAPTVQTIISDGQAVITGNYSLAEAREFTKQLNAGALPVPISLVSEQHVGATLGAESLSKSLYAGIVALILVMIFMVLYYRLPGVLAVIALALYVTLTLAIFKIIGVTLTLAGIAGLILSVGMAVDANVLIFERLKEELRLGKTLRGAIEEGFARAWTSIRDSNISTLITCLALIWFGTSFVKGFAATLAIGVVVSMFTAITISRLLLRFVVPWFGENGNWLFLGAKKKSPSSSNK